GVGGELRLAVLDDVADVPGPGGELGQHRVEGVDDGGRDCFGDADAAGDGGDTAAVDAAEYAALHGVAVALGGVGPEREAGDLPVHIDAVGEHALQVPVAGQGGGDPELHAGE